MQRRGQNKGNPSSPRKDGIMPRPGNAGWADSDAETAQTPQADSTAETISTRQKKESRLIAESGLSKRGSYLLSHLV